MKFPALSMVYGGASSGKSYFAERLVITMGGPRHYIATAQAFDPEMEAKIAEHRADRAADGWSTIEEPKDLGAALARVPQGDAVLIDCATMWLSNLLLSEEDIAEQTDQMLAAIAATVGPVVIVSNETGLGIVPENALARRFRQAQGRLNCQMAARADLVVQVSVGLPLVLKGTLPEGLQ